MNHTLKDDHRRAEAKSWISSRLGHRRGKGNSLVLCMLLCLLCPPSLGCGKATAEPSEDRYTSQAFPLSATWSPTGSPSSAHYGDTATLLFDGNVLFTGGWAELYNPASGTWSWTGSLADRDRYGHTATLLSDGKVLVVGGIGSSGERATAEVYNPALGTWSSTGSLTTARYGHTATLLPDGKVLVAGGINSSDGILHEAEVYDPASDTWSETESFAARACHTATLLPDGRVLVVGGFNSNVLLSAADVYDPALGTWSSTDSLAEVHYGHTATLLSDGRVLVTGGFGTQGPANPVGPLFFTTSEVYDPALGTWRETAYLPEARASHTATLLPDGKVLVAGGLSDGLDPVLDTAKVYDPAQETWSATGSMTSARYGFTATLLPDGTVLAAGDYDNSTTAEVYEP